MADARVYSAGVQRLYEPKDPPVRIYAAGVQVIRGTPLVPPDPPARRRQQQIVN